MDTLIHLIAVYGLLVVFVSVLLDQGGIPVPAYPPIILTAALATDQGKSVWPIILVASLAAVIADWLWYIGGRRLGAKLLRLMCRLSLSPDSCVLMDGEAPPLILDVRSEPQRTQTGWIPGSVFVQTVAEAPLMPREEVIVYCDCPNEASAAVLARALNKRGFKRVRPLAGGFAAWKSDGQLVSFE